MKPPSSLELLRSTPVVRGLLVASLVDSVGTGMYAAGGVIYFTRRLDLTATQVALGVSLGALVAALCVVLVGRAADRFGVGRMLVGLHLWSAIAFLCFLLVDDVTVFLLVACLVAVPERGWHPLASTVVSAVMSAERRTDVLAFMRVLRNSGFALGGLLAAGSLSIASGWALSAVIWVNALSFVGSATLLLALGAAGPDIQRAVSRLRAGAESTQTVPWRARLPYLKVAALDSVCCLHVSLLSIGIPLSVTLSTDLPTWAVASAYVLNTVLAVLFQRRVSGALKASVRSATVVMGLTLALLAATCTALALLPGLSLMWGLVCLASTVLVLTAAELSQAAASWTLALGLAPREGSAEIYATFELGFSAQLVFGPLLVAAAVDHGRGSWIVLAVALLAFVPLVAPVIRNAESRRASELASSG
ncbi:MFS transporter [Streptomyces europaeiscabiei]|uniref:MFS transporter n=1 Tax=Streptomyces europaeiscabiei TaxID=146819 RepID=UPI0029AFD847|nr:MFS transporter [Streptomyces europaeiscabiei]MDX3583347.1 MFS transporter [Streptomyces europaeiscabiei]